MFSYLLVQAWIQRGGGGGGARSPDPPPLEIYKAKGTLSNTDQDPFENHIAIKFAFKVGSLLTRQRNAI